MISCMTKNKIPYSRESEWRILSNDVDEFIKNGKLDSFIKPSRIFLGKNIFTNLGFKNEIEKVAAKLGISVVQR